MYDSQKIDKINLWYFEKDAGNELVCLPLFPCKKEACEVHRIFPLPYKKIKSFPVPESAEPGKLIRGSW